MSAFEDIDPDQERPNPVLVAAIAAPFEIPVLPVDELIATARASYNAYHHRPPAASLDQIVVDYLRFRAGFRDRTQPLFAIPGARATRIAMRENLHAGIVATYPHLRGECDRQMCQYRAKNTPAPKRKPKPR